MPISVVNLNNVTNITVTGAKNECETLNTYVKNAMYTTVTILFTDYNPGTIEFELIVPPKVERLYLKSVPQYHYPLKVLTEDRKKDLIVSYV